MAKEPQGFRETIEWIAGMGYKGLLSVRDVQNVMGCSYQTAREVIAPVEKVGGKVPIGAVAKLLCGRGV